MKSLTKDRFAAFTQRWGKPAALVLIYSALLALHLPIRPYADDLWYAEEVRQWNFFALQGHYYLTWSGRVFSSGLAFLLLDKLFWLWRLVNPLMLMTLAWGLARLASAKPAFKSFILALLLLFILGPGVGDYSIYWATGSLYYLWPATAAAFALHPFLDLLRARRAAGALQAGAALPAVKWLPLRIALVIPACFGNELLTLCLLGFMAVILLDVALYTRRGARRPTADAPDALSPAPGTSKPKSPLPRYLAIFAVALGCAAVLFLAPGSQSRYAHESRLYRDEYGIEFTRVPLGNKLGDGLAWMYDIIFVTLFTLLMLLFALAWWRRYGAGRGRLRLPLFALLCLSAAFAFPMPADAMFSFRPLGEVFSGGFGGMAAGLAPYAWWSLFLLGLFYLLARQGAYYALGLAAALCTGAVMIFSPTIYFSGERTMFVAGLIVITMFLALARNKVTPLPLTATACLALVCATRLVSRLALFYG